MDSESRTTRAIEPDYLGPLMERPLAESSRSGAEEPLFPGASKFLSARQQKRRVTQWSAARPLAEKLLRPDEHVLYVAHGMQMPSILHYLSLGAMALTYHQVVLVLTESRVIEVLLGVRGNRAETRIRTFPWASVRRVRMSLGKMELTPARGRKQSWKIPLRGDRRLLEPLLARLAPRCLSQGEAMAEPLPLWHCPQCMTTVPARPRTCDSCHATFRSPRLAALLSLAFPGAGLLYVGHPFLALADFLGEVLLYAIFLLLILEAAPGTAGTAIGLGVFFFLVTKLESIHVSRILAARSRLETAPRRSTFHRFALVGGLASVMLIGGALPLIGAARPVVDRDLDVVGEESVWEGSRSTAEWVAFADDPTARSQWTHPTGVRVTLFVYPQGMLDSAAEFRNDARRGLEAQGMTILKDDTDLPAPFHGFRFVAAGRTEDGEPITIVHAFIVDDRNHDIHHVLGAVLEEDSTQAEELVADLIEHARWIDPTSPQRLAQAPESDTQ